MPEIRYQFVASGGREVVDNFRSIEAAAKSSTSAVRELDRALHLRAPRGGSGGGSLGPGAGRGGPYRSPGGGGGGGGAAGPMSAAAYGAARDEAMLRRALDRKEGLIRASRRSIERELDREERAYRRSIDRREAADRRLAQSMANRAAHRRSAVGSAVASVGTSILGAGAGLAMTGVGLAGGLVRESLSNQSLANRVSISSRKAGQDAINPTTLRKEFESAALANPGVTAEDVGKAAKAYIDLTGDVTTARSSLGTFATVASATGAKIEDVATAAASLGDKFDVKKPEEMRQVLAALAFQGKEGAIELKDVAAQFQRLAAAGAAFGLEKGPAGVAKLGGLLQIARQGTGNARSAATAVENVFAGLTAKGGKIPGLKIYGKGGSKRDINEIVADAVSLAGGSNMAQKEASLLKVFGKQGLRAVNPLMNVYRDAAAGKSGKEAQDAGREAVLKTLREMSDAGAQWAEIERDAAQAQEDTSARLTGAWETLKAAAGDRLAPVVADLATKLATNKGALELFAAALGAAGAGLEAFADFLQKQGLIDGGTPEEQKAEALKRVGKYEAQLQTMGPDDPRYRDTLTKRNKAVEDVAAAKRAEALDKLTPGATDEQLTLFQKRYEAAAGDSTIGFLKARGEGRDIAEDLAKNRNDWYGSSDTLNVGETPAMTAERHKFMNREGDYAPSGGVNAGDTSTKGIVAEAMALVKAAAADQKAAADATKAAADKLGATNRPTVAGGTK